MVRSTQAVHRRRRLALGAILIAAACAVLAIVLGASASKDPPAPSPTRLVMRDGDRVIARLRVDEFVRSDGTLREAKLRRTIRRAVGARSVQRNGAATIVSRAAIDPAVRRAAALGAGGGTVQVERTPISSSVRAPVVAQQFRNNCESAALEVLLATTGLRVDQIELQRRLPRSGPRDPVDGPDGRVWGDPELGYVGRPEGGGVAGGFGVYQRPVRRLASALGRRLEDLSGANPSAVYQRVLSGRAVMVWIGLSEGPYGEWRSPAGGTVRVNFGEHTVVITGITADGSLRVVNPLYGTRERWSRQEFETMWARLDRRALAA
jgi:uncharacterized protein YvpB